jgi:feruloyl-CoA synthase
MDHVMIDGLEFAKPSLDVERRDDGSIVVKSGIPLQDYPDAIGHHLIHWAEAAPDRLFLAERDDQGAWRKFTYARSLDTVRAIGQYLLDHGLTADTPVMILSDNGLEHGFLTFAAMHVGIPAVPVSPAYSLMSQDHAKLKYIFDLIKPGLLFAADGAIFQKVIAALDTDGVQLVFAKNADAVESAISFDQIAATRPTAAVEDAFASVTPDTVGKILFTSGSTGMPKGVINSQRMLCSNQQAMAQVWRFLEKTPPVLVDWLPWNHTFGGNHNLNLVLRNGGSLYIDHGKPAPGLVEKSVANLREIPSTMYFNVPRGFEMILPFLEQDEVLRETFFRDLQVIFYGAAALPQNLWRRLEVVAQKAGRERIFLTAGWGSTETAPLVTNIHYSIEKAGVIGLPIPGTAIKMVPNAGKMELRVKGPNIMPAYFKNPDATADAFDDEGYYLMGDAGRFEDPDDPIRGLVFDGRTAENFKLSTGVWVHVGGLRIAVITASAPLVQDAVVTGHDRNAIGLLLFLNPAACAELSGLAADTPLDQMVANEKVRNAIADKIRAYNKDHSASSMRIDRVMLMTSPPSIDASEITDKAYINQRAVLANRSEQVDALYEGRDGALVID